MLSGVLMLVCGYDRVVGYVLLLYYQKTLGSELIISGHLFYNFHANIGTICK